MFLEPTFVLLNFLIYISNSHYDLVDVGVKLESENGYCY